MTENTSHEKFNQLRKQAEGLIKAREFDEWPGTSDDPLKLIHELQKFQVELELQNLELHRSQQELMRSQIRYTELYDGAPVGYVTLNSDGLILNSNLTLAKMLCMERTMLLNQPFANHIFFDDQDVFYHYLKNLSMLKKKQLCELRMQKKEGIPFDVQLESSIIPDGNDDNVQFRVVVIDIVERIQAERDRQRMESQSRFNHKMKSINKIAGGISHDFNNIFHIILGNVELVLEDTPKLDPAYLTLQSIRKTALRGASVVKALLNFCSRTDQDLKPVNIINAIKEPLEAIRSSIPATIEIREICPDPKLMILADQIQIGQILMNLCTNASQVMEQTGGLIEIMIKTEVLTDETVLLYPGLSAGTYVKMSVRDTGPGIDPEVVDQIFDPYFTTKDVGEGPGMGLAIVHGITKKHNGAITVETESGHGAVFNILFPEIEAESAVEIKKTDETPYGRGTILFVDDEEPITEMAQELLESFGYQVEAVLNPVEALTMFTAEPDRFDIVVTDMTMPKMTGIALFENIKKIRADIPVIICTGHSSLIDEEKANQLGIADYFTKPMSMVTLANRIRKLLNHQEPN